MSPALSLAGLLLVGTGAWAQPEAEPSPEPEGDDEIEVAKQHLDVGLKLYEVGRYAEAIEEFQTGYAIEPLPEFLFGWAQAARLSGHCEQALEQYRRVLETATESQAEVVQGFVDECEETLAAQQREAERQAEEAEQAARAQAEEQARAEREARELAQRAKEAEAKPEPAQVDAKDRPRDPIGPLFMGVGGAGMGVGLGLIILAELRNAAPGNAGDYEEFSEDYQLGQRTVPGLRIGGSIALAAGAALLTYGIARHVTKSRKRAQATASVWGTPTEAGVGLSGRF